MPKDDRGDYYDTACPKCEEEGRDTAGDNLRVYENTGLGYCLAGHEVVGKVKEIDKDAPAVRKKKPVDVQKEVKFLEGETVALPSRKITKKTCEFFGYQVNKAKKVHIANVYDESGKVVMQQLRTTTKQFPIIGNKEWNTILYGKWKWTPHPNLFITITEGQIDCLTVAQIMKLEFPVVSIPNGAPAAESVIRANMPWLSGFKWVVLCFDNDKPGRDAVEACLPLFEPGKVKVARLRLKDPSEYLVEGSEEELLRTIHRASVFLPTPILTGDNLLATLQGHKRKVRDWPWKIAQMTIAPISTPSVITIAALAGAGKTVVMADIMRDVISEGSHIGVISLEESIPNLILKLSDSVLGTNLRNITNRDFTPEEIEQARPITESIVTFNHKLYGSNVNTIIENLPYISQAMECEFIIFDNLSFATAGCGDNERRNLDMAMLALKDSSTKYDYTLFNVCHLHDDSKEDFRKASMRGSRGMMLFSDYVIYLGRDTEAQGPERNILTFYVKKDRETGKDTGKEFQLFYDPDTKRFKD